jgi:hypothetical protein
MADVCGEACIARWLGRAGWLPPCGESIGGHPEKWPADPPPAFRDPEEPEALTVPGEDLREPDPQHAVGIREAHAPVPRSVHDLKLMSQCQEFQLQSRSIVQRRA